MLRLESYLSPFLLSYLSKYIKDIEPKNLQFSLWGGDAVLHNVRFKLDALDNELFGAPFSFVSCQARELKMYVPWNKLASEAVVVTLDTVECVLKLQCTKPQKKPLPPKEENKQATQTQPSYVDGLMTKIKNNIKIVVNNLILKYIEDDVVLSINIQSATYQTVDNAWQPAFVELNENNTSLRQIFEIKDMTVCLDRRGTSGRVEQFEDPMLFRCHIIMRQHSSYPSPNSRKPSATKYNMMIERYDLTISETQLPAFLRLLQLCLHIYYGTILITRTQIDEMDSGENNEQNQQGWASWAWSYVPAIVNYDDLDEAIVRNPIIAFSLYIKNITISFKPSTATDLGSVRRSHSSMSQSFLQMNAQGFSLELVAKGLEFFSCDTVIAKCSMYCSRNVATVAKDGFASDQELGDNSVLLGYSSGSMLGFSANSLFDFRAPENNDVEYTYPLTKDAYFAEATQKVPKAFVAKYLYIAADGRNQEMAEEEDFNDFLRHIKLTDVSVWNNVRERSWKSFVIGGNESKILAGSHLVTSFDILNKWAQNHTFKSYPLVEKSHVSRPEKLDEMKILHFVPARNATFELENIEILCSALHIQPNTYYHKAFNRIDLLAKGSATQSHMHSDAINARLPCVVVSIPGAVFTMRQPMYGRHLAAYLSYFHSPPTKLMQTCNTCYSVNFDSIQLTSSSVKINPAEESDLKCYGSVIFEAKEFLLESYALQAHEYWKDRLSMLFMQLKAFLRRISVVASPVQLEMCLHVIDSWSHLFQPSKDVEQVLDVCFLQQLLQSEPTDRFLLTLENIIIECNNTFTKTAVTFAVKDFTVTWENANKVIKHLCTTAGVNKSSATSAPSCGENTNWLTAYAQIPANQSDDGCLFMHMHKLQISVVNELWKLASTLPNITPKQLLPVLFSNSLPTEGLLEKKGLAWKQRYVVQLYSKGIHMCIASKGSKKLSEQYDFDRTPGLHVCLPETSMCTTGHKRVPIQPQLLVEGILVNKYTEFGTFNITMERAEVFTILAALKGQSRTLHIAHAYSATCRLVVTPANKDAVVPSAAIHLDVEPIEIKVSQPQVKLLVELGTTALTAIGAVQANCMVPLMFHKTASHDNAVHLSAMSDVQSATQVKDDSKSNLSALVNKEAPKQVAVTVWLQCTLSRFSVSVYTEGNTKSALTVEDVSLSLDYQNVYLKLMCCCSGCVIHQYQKVDGNWQESDELGMLLSPIFSKLPVLVRSYSLTKCSHSKVESKDTLQQRKFCEITFTQALTSDYQKHLLDEGQESVDVGNSSIITASEPATSPTNLQQCVSELICSIQAFDFLINPDVIADLLPVFTPVLGMFGALQQGKSTASASSKSKNINLPVLYFMLAGSRVFLPCRSTGSTQDDVLIVCLSKLEVNPHPLNPLTRLVLAPSIYRKAGASGLLHSAGSPLEDKQLEITLDDVSIGTTKWNEVLAYLKQPLPYENPALKWNLTGKVEPPQDPSFHPVLQEFDFQLTVAPPIWYKNKLQKWIIVCAPSFEASFSTDVVLHFTKMQVGMVTQLVEDWTHMYLATFLSEKTLHRDSSSNHTPEDSGLSVSEASQVTEKPVVSSTTALVGDGLVAAHNVKVLVYEYLFTDEGTGLKPTCMLSLCEPSLVVHVSRTQQKLEIQLHDLSMNLAEYQPMGESSLDKALSFPVNFIETKSGDSDKRTGVPPSLCTISVQHFLTSKASVQAKVGRPIKVSVRSCLFKVLKDVMSFLPEPQGAQNQTTTTTTAPSRAVSQLPSVNLETVQLVLELIEDKTILRCALSGFHAKSQNSGQKITGSAALTDLSVRLKSTNQYFIPILSPVTVSAKFNASLVKDIHHTLHNVLFNTTPARVSLNKQVLSDISKLGKRVVQWTADLFPEKDSAVSNNLNSLQENDFDDMSICITNVDDLRTGSYTYVVSNNQMPIAKQIVFTNDSDLCAMAWCYDKPHAIRHVFITPIPFNNPLSGTVSCKLQCFNDTKSVFDTVQNFQLSELDHVDFTVFDDSTPFYKVASSTQWRVVIESHGDSIVSPMSLAAAMQVESIFKTLFVPTLAVQILSDEIELCLTDGDTDCLRFILQSMDTSARMWYHDSDVLSVVQSKLACCMDVIDFTNLTWLPVLAPNLFEVSIKKDIDSVDCRCVCERVTEMHVSQKIIHSYGYIQDSVLKNAVDTKAKCCITLHNNTAATLVFGQVLTDECITLLPNTKAQYYWRTHKVDPKLHVSLEGIPDWNWTHSFSIGEESKFVLAIDHLQSVVVDVKKSGPVKTDLTFNGQIKVISRLPFEMQCQLMYENQQRKEYNLEPNEELQLLSSISAAAFASFKMQKTSHEPQKLAVEDLVKTSGNTMSIEFNSTEKEPIYCLVCYHRGDLVDVITLMPHFIVRSHLPKPAYLHIDTRSRGTSISVQLEGCGVEVPLLRLLPNTTHHLTVQLNENQSPFDAKIPIHSSLVYSMDETHNLDEPLCSLEQYYPYNSQNYKKVSSTDFWSAGDGNIHANLSLYNYSLLVEITPWCLIVNNTSEVICFVSKGNATSIVQPGDTVVPHHFTGPFYIRTSNSSHSQKLKLLDDLHADHPARINAQPGQILTNSIHNVYLKKQGMILDLTLKSCIRHGIRILTVSPTWWFVNMSTSAKHLLVSGCTSQQKDFSSGSSNALEINTALAVPIVAWHTENSLALDGSDAETEAEPPSPLVSSAEETSSSFICVENGNTTSEMEYLFADRSLALFVGEQRAVVSIEDEFSKRLVDFSSNDKKNSSRMIITKHSEDDHLYIVLNDLVHCRYKVGNMTAHRICFREVTDQLCPSVENVLPPGGSMLFESYMDAESFPKCRRVYRSINLQLSVAEEANWASVVIPDIEYTTEVDIPGMGMTHVHVSRCHGVVLIQFKDSATIQEAELPATAAEEASTSFNCQLSLAECKIVLLDDISNPSNRLGIVSICLSEVMLKAVSDPLSKAWYTQFSLGDFQLDNQLFSSPEFPVFFWSCQPYTVGSVDKALLIDVTFTEEFQLESVDVHSSAVQLKLESVFAKVLSSLLQSYVDSAQQGSDSLKAMDERILDAVKNEAATFCNPLRFTNFTIHPFVLILSLRADVKLYVSVDRGAISFSKFVCCDIDTTVHELVQELSRHYFADAVYGAGWILGSLDILGNPATTLRSFLQGVTDLVVLPYQGLSQGPTAFIGGVAQGVSSLLKHFSSGTLRSITNIAAGISRNLGPTPNVIQQSQVEAEINVLSKLGKKSVEAEKQGYVGGIGKALVHVMTRPIGGAAGIVSKAGETILRRAGLEVYKTTRYTSLSLQSSLSESSLSKFARRVTDLDDEKVVTVVGSLPARMISVDIMVMFVLTETQLFIIREEEEAVETVLQVKDIQLFVDTNNSSEDHKQEQTVLVIQRATSVALEKKSVYKEKVAEYLGVEDEINNMQEDGSKDVVKYSAEVKSLSLAKAFCSTFEKLKPKPNRFKW